MERIVLVSDSHMRTNILDRIEKMYPDANRYLLCGDSSLPKNSIGRFISVAGNHDYVNYKDEYETEIEGNRILMVHGHLFGIYPGNITNLIEYATSRKYDIVFYGHTHIFMNEVINGIRFINPGSIFFSRDMSEPSFAYIEIDGKDIKVQRIEIPYKKGEKW